MCMIQIQYNTLFSENICETNTYQNRNAYRTSKAPYQHVTSFDPAAVKVGYHMYFKHITASKR